MADMAAYGMTKAAAIIATTKFALKLKDEGFVVVTLSPGMVDTSATAGTDRASATTLVCAFGERSVLMLRLLGDAVTQGLAAFASSVKTETRIQVAAQTPERSIAAQLRVIDGLQPSHNGAFLSHNDGGEYRPPS